MGSNTGGVAMLGMYDAPAFHPVNDAFWSTVRGALGYGPQRLTRDRDFADIWRDPDMILSQTCGYPYRAGLADLVQLVGTPDYGIEGCPAGYYRSGIFVRKGSALAQLADCNGRTMAFNDALSQSGWAGPQELLLQHGVQAGALVQTGGHAASLSAIVRGDADFAGIDLQTHWMLRQTDPAVVADVTCIAYTAPTPGLPFITAADQDAASVTRAVEHALERTAKAEAKKLHIRGLIQIDRSAYEAVATPPTPAQSGLPIRPL
jgi:ABC-type phosphate/phosphonate transport system substrate-binding protein